jgi:uncharacterized membrane protein YesL
MTPGFVVSAGVILAFDLALISSYEQWQAVFVLAFTITACAFKKHP